MGKKVKEYDKDMYLLTMGSSELNTMIVRPYLQQLTGSTVLVNETKKRGFEEKDLVEVLNTLRHCMMKALHHLCLLLSHTAQIWEQILTGSTRNMWQHSDTPLQ